MKTLVTIIVAAITLSLNATEVSYSREQLMPGFDGKYCKIQPSVTTDGKGTTFLTYQKLLLTGDDVFYGQFISRSSDAGKTWSEPQELTALKDTHERGLRVAHYANPLYLAKANRWIALGTADLFKDDVRPYQVYENGQPYGWPLMVDMDPISGTYTGYRKLDFPFEYEFAMPFGQTLELEDGEVLIPFYFRPVGGGLRGRCVVVRYRFDGKDLKVVRAGKPIVRDDLARGVGEPSIIRYKGKIYMTLRSDEYGMWCASDDGLVFDAPRPWTWTDGKLIGNRNTQQHWMQVGDKLYLAYTRETPTNKHVFRNRAPIFSAQVDVERGGLKLETEVAIVPERGARLGNFFVTHTGDEAWLITAEWMQPRGCEKHGSDNSLWLVKARVADAKPSGASRTSAPTAAIPPKVILDTDMLTDFDDVGALACLHALADAGECEILATLSCTRGNASVGAVQIINSYYGRSNIPVGCAKEIGVCGIGPNAKTKVDPKSPPDKAKDGGHYKYRKLLADYPNMFTYADSDDAPDANGVYRKVLAAAPDNSVVICSIGFLTNLRRLLETKGDQYSPLDGKALVAKKVRKWVAMACNYPRGKEYNSMWDPESSRIALENWPTPIVFSDFQYGMDLFAGRAIAEMSGERNPVKDVFAGNIPSRDTVMKDAAKQASYHYGMGGRAAWDETAVLVAVRGEQSYFNVHRGCYRMVGDKGDDEWVPDEENGPHLRITERIDKDEVGKVIDELICRPPKTSKIDATQTSKAQDSKAMELKNDAEFTLANVPSELTAQLKRGGSVRFLLEENGTTGYQWEATYASNECSVVIEHRGALGDRALPEDGGSAGAPRTQLVGVPGKASLTITKNAAVQSPSLVEFTYRRSWEKGNVAKRVRLVLYTIPGEVADFRYPASRTLDMLKAECKNRGIELIDWHVHIRGGLTPEMAAEREKACGIRQSAMENHGREWEIFDNARLVAFAEKARVVKVNGHTLPVGIQVNDRDWFKQIDAATRAKFDYILADTMIMGKLPNGRDKRLWLIKDIAEIGDTEKWMDEYVAMNLQILGEPISILANPGYLPTPLNGMHDQLWTEARMRKVIGKAVERGIAIEIQAESPYPSPKFLKLAKAMGAKFSFGTNNYDAAPKNLSRWLEAIVWLDLKGEDIWQPNRH